MKFRLALILTLLVLCTEGCGDPVKEPVAAYLVVNGVVGDSGVKVPSSGGSVEVSVRCDADWTAVRAEESAWISVGEKIKSGRNLWTLPLMLEPNESESPRTGGVKVTAGSYSYVLTVTQSAPDPLTLNRIPGFYGLEGGDVTLSGTRQASSYHFGNMWMYRILDPVTMTVWALGGIPEELSEGDVVKLRYKMISAGMEESKDYFTDVSVVRSTPSLVWLRQNESVYFVLDR